MRIMKKRMLSLLCAVAIVLGMIVPSAFAATDTTCDCGATDVQWETLTASTTPQPGKHYRLSGDVTWSSQMSLKTEGTYCIDLAVYTMQNKTNRALVAVEIIIQTTLGRYKQGRGNAQDIELNCQIALEKVLDLFNGKLGLTEAQKRAVIIGNSHFRHNKTTFRGKKHIQQYYSRFLSTCKEKRQKFMLFSRFFFAKRMCEEA